VAGTIYEAIHYAVLSNFLLLSAKKFYGLINIAPKPSLWSFLNVTDQVSQPQLWKYYVSTHTYIFISIVMLPESSKERKSLRSCSEHYFTLFSSQILDPAIIFLYCQSQILQFPQPSKFSNNVSGWSCFFNVSYPSCALQYIIIAEMISGRYLSLTNKGIWLLHVKKVFTI